MPGAAILITYKLAKNTSEQDFLPASEKMHGEFMSKQKGFISWQILAEADTYTDVLIWETMEDAQNAMRAGGESTANQAFFSLFDPESIKMQFLTMKKSY